MEAQNGLVSVNFFKDRGILIKFVFMEKLYMNPNSIMQQPVLV